MADNGYTKYVEGKGWVRMTKPQENTKQPSPLQNFLNEIGKKYSPIKKSAYRTEDVEKDWEK